MRFFFSSLLILVTGFIVGYIAAHWNILTPEGVPNLHLIILLVWAILFLLVVIVEFVSKRMSDNVPEEVKLYRKLKDDRYLRLTILKELNKDNVISEQEYESEKTKILSK